MTAEPETRHRTRRLIDRLPSALGESLPGLVAVVVVGALLVGTAVAISARGPTRRRALVELVGWNMAIRLRPVPTTHMVKRADRRRRRTSVGYRGAVVLHEPGVVCDERRRPVACGAMLEVYRDHDAASSQGTRLSSRGEQVRVRGAFVLRSDRILAAARWRAYVAAFGRALARMEDLSDIAGTDAEPMPEVTGLVRTGWPVSRVL